MSSVAVAPRARKSFSRLKHVLDLPDLIDIQKASFHWFLEGGLRETIDDISPIEDYTGTLAVEFAEYEFGEPQFTIQEAVRGPDLPGPALDHGPLRQQGHRRDPRAAGLHGRLPDDDPVGDLHHQRHRARHRHAARPEPWRLSHGAEGRHEAGVHGEPHALAWLVARGRDRQEGNGVRTDRPEAQLPITTLLRALPAEDPSTGFQLDTPPNEKILELSTDRSTSPTRSRRIPRRVKRKPSSRSSRSSDRVSLRRSTTRGTSCALSSSTRSATT